MAGSVIFAGLTQVATGMFNSLSLLIIMRMAHAAANSILQPLFYSMIGDYIPKSKRATANSILQSASYMGIALSSLSVLLL